MAPTMAEVIFWIVLGIVAIGVFGLFNCRVGDYGEIEMSEYKERDICRAVNSWERNLR